MPVELPASAPKVRAPSPPNIIFWLGALVVAVLASAAWTLLTWPKQDSTMSMWFWSRLLVFPIVGWCAVFGLRLFYHDEEMTRLAAEANTNESDRAKAIEFAQEPLAVMGLSYVTAMEASGEGVASAIAQKIRVLKVMSPRSGAKALRHTSLSFSEDLGMPDRYQAVFVQLLASLKDPLDDFPIDVPFSVRLQLPKDADQTRMAGIWKACWLKCGYTDAPVQLLDSESGLMALDSWLDIGGGPTLEKFTLFVAVQLHHESPENSAEAAAAVLLGWAPLAERRGLKPITLLHRPVEAQMADLMTSLPKSLKWGRATATQVNHVWQAGLASEDKFAFLKKSGDIGLQASQTKDFSGVHDIDRAIGNPGTAAGWLSVALACEHAWRTTETQLVFARENSLRLAVVQPLANEHQMERIQ